MNILIQNLLIPIYKKKITYPNKILKLTMKNLEEKKFLLIIIIVNVVNIFADMIITSYIQNTNKRTIYFK